MARFTSDQIATLFAPQAEYVAETNTHDMELSAKQGQWLRDTLCQERRYIVSGKPADVHFNAEGTLVDGRHWGLTVGLGETWLIIYSLELSNQCGNASECSEKVSK